jgi:hypothetical protein
VFLTIGDYNAGVYQRQPMGDKEAEVQRGRVNRPRISISEPQPRSRSGKYDVAPQPVGRVERTRRLFQVAEQARGLGIPVQSLTDHAEVAHYAGVYHDGHYLQQDLEVQRSHGWRVEGDGLPSIIQERYGSGELLLRVGLEMLQEGFNGQTVQQRYMQENVQAAIGKYGLRVVPPQHDGDGLREHLRLSAPSAEALPVQPAEGAWQSQADEPRLLYADELAKRHDSWQRQPDPSWWRAVPEPQERQEPAFRQQVWHEAAAWGLAEQVVVYESTNAYLSHLVSAKNWAESVRRGVHIAAPEGGLAPGVGGLYPPARERLKRVGHLAEAVVMILEDGLGEEPLDPTQLAAELNEALKAYGLSVESEVKTHAKAGADQADR